jgi:hypothetical protein
MNGGSISSWARDFCFLQIYLTVTGDRPRTPIELVPDSFVPVELAKS